MLLLVAGAGSARADQPLWEAGIGAAALRLPHYRGSSESHGWLLPVPYLVYRGQFLQADRDGARALLFDGERVDFDLSVSASPPTRSDDSRVRSGMPDLAPSVEIGPKFNLRLAQGRRWKLDLRVPLRAVVSLESRPRALGWTLQPVLNGDLRLGGYNLGLQAGPLWGDRRLHGEVYGVAPAYATPGRPAYAAAGGYAGWHATLAFSRRVGRLWWGGFLRHDSVRRAAFEASPLVTARQTMAMGLAVSWVCAVSDVRVADDR